LVLLCHWPSRSMNRSRRCSVSRETGVSASAADLSAASVGEALRLLELTPPFLPVSPLPTRGEREDVLVPLTARSTMACGEMARPYSSEGSERERPGTGLVSRETPPTRRPASCAALPGANKPPRCQVPPASFHRCGSPAPRSTAAPHSAWPEPRLKDQAPDRSQHR
jgi:hypothetical protein